MTSTAELSLPAGSPGFAELAARIAALVGTAPGPPGSGVVPATTKTSRVAPMRRARAAAPASGDTGAGSVRPLRCGRRAPPRPSSLVTAAATPYQARALTSPASPDTATAAAVGAALIATAAADSTTKLASSQPTARADGRVRHQDPVIPPCASAIRMSSMAGSAAKNGQENGSSDTPNSSVTTGASSTPATTVNTMQRANVPPQRGAGRWRGHASRIATVLTAARASTRAA